MSITITIEGNHPTDVLAQLQQLAAGLANQQMPAPVAVRSFDLVGTDENGNIKKETVSFVPATNNMGSEAPEANVESPKKLSRGEHKAEADKMIAAGKIDQEIFPLLSKNQQERVEAALNAQELSASEDENPLDLPTPATKAAPQPKEEVKAPVENKKDVGGLFDDEDEAEEESLELTIDDLRALITKKCKDKNGKDIPEMYSAVRAEIKNVVPKDKEPKVSEVPANKYVELHNAINSIVL